MVDISIKLDEGKFNYRIVIVLSDKQRQNFLIHTIKGFDFWLLPGGRCKLMENSKDGVFRELEEELGNNLQINNLKAVGFSENFFNFKEKNQHEISVFYHGIIDDKDPLLLQEGLFSGKEGEKYLYKWAALEEIKEMNFQPVFAVDLLEKIQKDYANNKETNMQHIIMNEIKK